MIFLLKNHINGDVRPSLLSDPRPAPPPDIVAMVATGLALGLSPAAASAAGFSAFGPSAASGIWEKAKTWSMGCFCAAKTEDFWLVVWTIFSPFSREFHHPNNWRAYFSEGLKPPTRFNSRNSDLIKRKDSFTSKRSKTCGLNLQKNHEKLGFSRQNWKVWTVKVTAWPRNMWIHHAMYISMSCRWT